MKNAPANSASNPTTNAPTLSHSAGRNKAATKCIAVDRSFAMAPILVAISPTVWPTPLTVDTPEPRNPNPGIELRPAEIPPAKPRAALSPPLASEAVPFGQLPLLAAFATNSADAVLLALFASAAFGLSYLVLKYRPAALGLVA